MREIILTKYIGMAWATRARGSRPQPYICMRTLRRFVELPPNKDIARLVVTFHKHAGSNRFKIVYRNVFLGGVHGYGVEETKAELFITARKKLAEASRRGYKYVQIEYEEHE